MSTPIPTPPSPTPQIPPSLLNLLTHPTVLSAALAAAFLWALAVLTFLVIESVSGHNGLAQEYLKAWSAFVGVYGAALVRLLWAQK